MTHKSPSPLKKRHFKGSASRHHVQYTGQYLLECLWHGAILDNIAVEWIVMAFSVINSAGNGWADGIRRVLVWISMSVYFHIAVVSIQRLVSLGHRNHGIRSILLLMLTQKPKRRHYRSLHDQPNRSYSGPSVCSEAGSLLCQ